MPSALTKSVLASSGGVIAAVGSTLCCAGPLVAVLLGMSGAGLAATFEPLRPLFVIATIAALGSAWALVRREERRACVSGSLCASPRARRWMKWSVWSATLLAVPLLTFSWWSRFVLPAS
jgi:mercuric ion transport protein